MNRFAELLDRLAYEPRRNAKIALVKAYFRATEDPDRGYALAAMTGGLVFTNAKPGLIRTLIAERTDPVLFALSYDYVGDLSETVALMWPRRSGTVETPSPTQQAPTSPLAGEVDAAGVGRGVGEATGVESRTPPSPALPHKGGGSAAPDALKDATDAPPLHHNRPPLTLAEVVETLRTAGKSDLPRLIATWLDALDETGRWALLKLITGALRIGVSARLAKTALAEMAGFEPDAIEEVWHGLEPPYAELFAWVEGRGPRPEARDPAPFRPPMLAHALEEADIPSITPEDFVAEWKWDGIRVQAVAGRRSDGRRIARLYSRSGDDISQAFPDLVDSFAFDAAIDGELLILREGVVQSFNVLQQRLNRKSVTQKLILDFPAHIRAYDLLVDRETDLRPLAFTERRARLEAVLGALNHPRIHVSPLLPFASFAELAAARADPAATELGADATAVEGVMLKRADSAYVPGRPKGQWYKWKREPHVVDAVLMYAQRGHGKRSSYYSDFTFGVWKADELVPVGKAYFGFTDAELLELDRFVRKNTVNRFGPVREVVHTAETGLVLEIAFEGLQRSTRHKSGVAMRFPRIARIRWDKRAAEADRIEALEGMLGAAV